MSPFWLLFFPAAAAALTGWMVRSDGFGWRDAILMGILAFVVVLMLEVASL